ncbi:MAG: hypothetical protein Q4C50_06495 [Eubacteriales bacterium]|nr:hypothetical protein [Eubacteriales bacterium]
MKKKMADIIRNIAVFQINPVQKRRVESGCMLSSPFPVASFDDRRSGIAWDVFVIKIL